MKIKWLGHAAFLITSESGTRIITDPYKTGKDLEYGEIDETASIVTISHDHYDHSNTAAVKGSPRIIRGSETAEGITFRGITTAHDDTAGSQRGVNTIFCFMVDGVRICHLGDLGHLLTEAQTAEIGPVDVLLIPVGGFFTIDAATAGEVCDSLHPGVIIPMHFKNDKCHFPITGVEEFLKGKPNVTRLDTSEAEFKAGQLPSTTRIMVLKPAR